MYRTAIVNSRTFLVKFPDLEEKLSRLTEVIRLQVPKDIEGKELAKELKGYQFVVASVTPYYSREFFEENEDVILIARHGIGVDNIDLNAATEYGVIVTRVPGYREREAVAELTIALMLSVIRRICSGYEAVRRGRWGERGKLVGFELKGKTIGIIGLGNIGSRVAEILSKGFNAKVIAFDPYVDRETAFKYGAELVGFERLLRESDIITLHCPLTQETYHLLNDEAFRKMKRGIILINAARGELIDTEALIKALREGIVAGVGLDVVEREPIGADHPLLEFENVVIVPHIGANTLEGLRGMDESCVNAIIDVINGKVPEGIVNPEVIKKGVRGGLRV